MEDHKDATQEETTGDKNDTALEDGLKSPRGEDTGPQDYGNLKFGEYLLDLNGVSSRFILFRDFVDDEVKAIQYEKHGEDSVLVLHHSKWRRRGDNITWQREGVDAQAFSGMISPDGYLGGGVFKALSFVSKSKKPKPWTATFERKLI